jgi:L-threonylcarbamoyladenylate synthase
MPTDPINYARILYATLHDLDRQGLARIIVEPPPPEREWLAIRDRLRRAATPP